ncbi:hypothetical protein CEXT_767981, partial [Caerostris extrusa]
FGCCFSPTILLLGYQNAALLPHKKRGRREGVRGTKGLICRRLLSPSCDGSCVDYRFADGFKSRLVTLRFKQQCCWRDDVKEETLFYFG